MPTRMVWLLLALVLAMARWLMLLDSAFGQAGYVVVGVGAGIGCAVLGSLAHDALS